MKTYLFTIISFLISVISCSTTSKIEQYGSMHAAIGRQQHQGRVSLNNFTNSKDYIGIGAIEKLEGEVTIINGDVIATIVNESGEAVPLETQKKTQATMLIATKVKSWKEIKVDKDMSKQDFEIWLSEKVENETPQSKKSLMFKVKGDFINLHTHVINGACPVHAHLNKIPLPPHKKPYKKFLNRQKGLMVGIFAPNSTGRLTHPGTNIHTHIVFKNLNGKNITGHIESSGIAKGSILYLPKV